MHKHLRFTALQQCTNFPIKTTIYIHGPIIALGQSLFHNWSQLSDVVNKTFVINYFRVQSSFDSEVKLQYIVLWGF